MFADRSEAGRRVAALLGHLRGGDVVVLGLPRGGVVVAVEVADALKAPLDVILVRKLGVPIQPELGFGALGEDGVRVVNPDVVRMAQLRQDEMERVEERERGILRQRAERLRAGRPRIPLTGRTAVIVDDGIATGSTARAACEVARAHGAARVVVAVPVCPEDGTERLRGAADEVICAETPADLGGIGLWYEDFTQVTDDQVTDLLTRHPSPFQPAQRPRMEPD
ncbi:phosphoribosyltransferase [Nonomuraea sp. K274]|uniref:Phosphoribosyltransferase n=1 Tax=Nonomuraea cypriaca TaxID=1187855 RepID=A0A931ACZ3_9ACTN|nr:phosphoribosyltransferase family protein [Nonomuraea cypriaca]MBF8188799.1 phosphoribosyltransferase [Nonomuraea cypriaca]